MASVRAFLASAVCVALAAVVLLSVFVASPTRGASPPFGPDGEVMDDGGATISIGQVWAVPGMAVDVPISIETDLALNVFALSIEFPTESLDLVDVELRNSVKSLLAARPSEESAFTWIANEDEGWLQILLVADFAGQEGRAVPPGLLRSIFTLRFKVAEDAEAGSLPLILTLDGEASYEGTFVVDGEPVHNRFVRPGRAVSPDEPLDGSEVPRLNDGEISVAIIGDVGIFVRGDANADQIIDVSDPVRILTHLFAGGAPLDCPPASDVNIDGTVDIADPVVLLDYLFKGSTAFQPATVVLSSSDPLSEICAPYSG